MARYGDGTRYGQGARYGSGSTVGRALTDAVLWMHGCYQVILRRRC